MDSRGETKLNVQVDKNTGFISMLQIASFNLSFMGCLTPLATCNNQRKF